MFEVIFCSVLALVILGILLDYFWTAIFRGTKKGRFKIKSDTSSAFQFDTDFGSFRIDHIQKRISVFRKQKRISIPLDEIAAVRYKYDDEWAYFHEWLFGFGYTDLLNRYSDVIHWYTIKIQTKDGKEIPIFVAGQWEPKEFLLEWYIQLQENILSSFGLFNEIDDYCSDVFDQLYTQLRKSGVDVPLR